ncbi:hypothetical protein RchiOBHm_Chr7g0202071 [Rosa chinensis]|uniref:Uncharacterized protein n=1 Tax=Rosa chinensis TaxID=74649 RepID=A0A2P6P841_ROSCH|nr:hypothetical protein RchiOBHm_Chr7g0202071 [Rosa chinensis]
MLENLAESLCLDNQLNSLSVSTKVRMSVVLAPNFRGRRPMLTVLSPLPCFKNRLPSLEEHLYDMRECLALANMLKKALSPDIVLLACHFLPLECFTE